MKTLQEKFEDIFQPSDDIDQRKDDKQTYIIKSLKSGSFTLFKDSLILLRSMSEDDAEDYILNDELDVVLNNIGISLADISEQKLVSLYSYFYKHVSDYLEKNEHEIFKGLDVEKYIDEIF